MPTSANVRVTRLSRRKQGFESPRERQARFEDAADALRAATYDIDVALSLLAKQGHAARRMTAGPDISSARARHKTAAMR